jgi:hypothetical protein
VRALVVVLVAAHDEVNPVGVEERHPFLADAEVRAVGQVGGADDDLVGAHDEAI